MAKYNILHVNWIQKTYGARMIRLLGSSALHVYSPLGFLVTYSIICPPPLPPIFYREFTVIGSLIFNVYITGWQRIVIM